MSHHPHTTAPTATPVVTVCRPSDCPGTATASSPSNALILVVEDHCVNRDVALRTLRKLGFRAEAVTNGLEAIEALRAVAYDLVLMDVRMPEMNGLEATRVIRNPDSGVPNPQVPIVAMTVDAMFGTRKQCFEAGMDDFLGLPVSRQMLAETIHSWLSPQNPRTRTDVRTHPEHETIAPSPHAALLGDQPWNSAVLSQAFCPSV